MTSTAAPRDASPPAPRVGPGLRRRVGAAIVERASVRTTTAALMVLPTALCAVLLGVGIAGHVATVQKQQQTVRAIAASTSLQSVADALEAESSPSLVAYLLRPGTAFERELGPYLTNDYGPAQLRATRAATDSAFGTLPRDLADAPDVTAMQKALAALRSRIDANDEAPAATFSGFLTMVNTLSGLEQTRLNDALQGGTSRKTVATLQQMAAGARLLATADELNRIAGAYRFDIATSTDVQKLRMEFLQSWGSYSVLAQDFQQEAGGEVLALWKATEASPAARRVAAAYESRALAPTTSPLVNLTTLNEELSLQQDVNTHEAGLHAMSQSANAAAEKSIKGLQRSATRWLWFLSAAIAATLAFLVALLFIVTRTITRPLLVLADEARQVSQGVLVDVRPSGPREVQVVGEALRAAVDSLRQLQAQVEAVARGDLKDPTLEHSLPGRLGEVMHTSVDAVVTTLRERDVLQDQLAHQATHDALTDLPNRAETYRQVEAALQRTRRSDKTVGLLFLDLDRFKAVNDTYGHHAGDQVLETVAQRLIALVRAGDSVGRLGGDEFVIVTETVRRREDLRDFAKRVTVAVNKPIMLKGATEHLAHVGVSIGIAMDFDGFISAAQFVMNADTALYRAKTSRLGGTVFADELDPPADHAAFIPFSRSQSADQ